MKCPYCNAKMPVGYLYNGSQPLQWIPEDKRPSMWSWTTTPDGRTLKNKFYWFRRGGGYNAKAYCCDRCHVVIAPTKYNTGALDEE